MTATPLSASRPWGSDDQYVPTKDALKPLTRSGNHSGQNALHRRIQRWRLPW